MPSGLAGFTANTFQTCVTSPPYFGQRDYQHSSQIGLEGDPATYVAELVSAFREVRRILRNDGTLWIVLGDTYANKNTTRRATLGVSAKNLIGIPWRVALALQEDGWYLRSDIIWHKPSPMTESVKDRPTKSHEYIFLLSKRPRYFYDSEAIMEPKQCERPRGTGGARRHFDGSRRDRETLAAYGNADALIGKRNKRSVWKVPPKPFPGAHFATYPPELIRPCIRAGCPPGGLVLDPFAGAGTTGIVCRQEGRRFFGVELNGEYAALARKRIDEVK